MSATMAKAAWETVWYFVAGGPITLAACVVALGLASPLVFVVGLERGVMFARRAVVFMTVLFMCGAPANAIFTVVLRDRFYFAADPITDWLPWLPSGDWVLDMGCGGHYLAGASAWTLRTAWLLLAIPVWAASIRIYCWLLRHEWSW